MSLESMLIRNLNRRRRRRAVQKSGICLGETKELLTNEQGPFSLPPTLVQHSFISGRTGCGKTTLLLRLMAEYYKAAIPFLFIDLHGQATDDLLALIGRGTNLSIKRPPLLIEPWADRVMGWNPLEATGEFRFPIAQELVSIFHYFWRDAWGPRLEELLLMTLLALIAARLTILEATLFLTLAEFRRNVLRDVDISEVREFWTLRFERLSPSQRSSFMEPVLNKIRVFHDPALKYLVGQQRSTLDLDRALGEAQTIIANFPSARLQGSNQLLGALLLAKFKGAVYRRPANAPPYGLILDEFQEMLTW